MMYNKQSTIKNIPCNIKIQICLKRQNKLKITRSYLLTRINQKKIAKIYQKINWIYYTQKGMQFWDKKCYKGLELAKTIKIS